jgi:3-hydroxyisobutyrate dehydrogenase
VDERTIAVLGAGTMGAPMAANLARAGFSVRLWNRTRERAEAVEGVAVADDPAGAAAGAGAVVTMLADGDAVAGAMAEGGALAAMDDDALWLQTSTVGLAGTERLAAHARERGVTFVDAPVLGTRGPAEEGTLTVLASGPEAARARCEPILAAIGSRIRWVGEAGAGSRLKLAVNVWLIGLTEAAAESVALARRLGIDPEEVLDTVSGTPVDCAYLHAKGRLMIERRFPPSFRLRLARKDIGLVLEAAEAHGLDLPLPRATAETFDRAIAMGHGDEDMAATYLGLDPPE